MGRIVWNQDVYRGLILGAVFAVSLLGAACGSPGGNQCANKTCAFGTCDSDDGECENAPSCREEDDCLPGFTCGEEGSCVAETKCESNGDCKVGVCRDGACVNPEKCSKHGDCLPETYCDKEGNSKTGTCKPDPCRDVRCPRGVCKTGTDKCVSKESCTEDNELRACAEGERCADGNCVPNEKFCEVLKCERGTCSLDEGECVNADECKADADCLEGWFCNDMNLCQRDLCDRDDIRCGSNGVCQPKAGLCENASKCTSNDDCLDDHLCLKGTCKLAATACGNAGGDGGCPGNQTCEYDANSKSVSCREPEVCETTLDCQGDARCNGRNCIAPRSSCDDDRFEGNDKKKNATDFNAEARQQAIWATMCSGNTDYYQLKTTEIVSPTTRGKLVVEVDVPERDRGLGQVKLELIDETGTSQGTATTGASGADGVARVTKRILIHNHGTYTVKVSAGGDIDKPGVAYQLSAELLPKETLKACSNAQKLRPNQRTTGQTDQGASNEIGSTCTTSSNKSKENIYRIDLERPQEIRAKLSPRTSGADFSMSLRRQCARRASEVACVDASKSGSGETLTKIVGAGTYYLIVQPPEGATGGTYQLELDRVLTACSAEGNYCDPKGNAHECTADGSHFKKVQCDNGCDRSRGRCVPPDGDICGTAKTINPSNAQKRTLGLNQATDSYSVGSGACLGFADTQTGGPDLTWKVEIPARRSVKLETTFANGVEGSMYLVESCSDVDSTCRQGVKGSTNSDDREVLRYSNTSQSAETLYLIVDTKAGQQVTKADLKVSYKKVICTPGNQSCTSGDVQKCGPYGTKRTTVQSCGTLGCSSGSCVGDTCQSAVSVPANGNKQTYTWSPSNYNDDYDIDFASCLSDDSDSNDVVFEVQPSKGDVVDVDASLNDARVYIVEAGNCGSVRSSCLVGKEGPNGVKFTWQAPNASTYYIIADRDNLGSSGTATIDITVSKPQCVSSSFSASCNGDTLETCDKGKIVKTNCPGGCTAALCQANKADTCSKPQNATTQAGSSGGVTYSSEWGLFSDDINGNACGSSGPGSSIGSIDTDGRETVYRIDLKSGETLSASLPPPGDVSLYLKASGDCGNNGTSCLAGDEADGGTASISYSASSNETVYLVADRERDPGTDVFSLDIQVQ